MGKNRKLRAELASLRQRLETLFAHSPDMIFFLDRHGRIFEASTKAEPILRYPQEKLFAKSYVDMLLEQDIPFVRQRFANVMAGGVERFETKLKDIDGVPKDIEILGFPVIEDGEVVGAFGFARDIAKQKQLEAALHEMAYHDYLTGLQNQRALQQHLLSLIGAGLPFAMMMIDLDRFKSVNDSWGHESGDALLVSVTARLRDHLPANAKLFRYGGDELVAVLQSASEAEVLGFAEMLLQRFEEPFELKQHLLSMSASIGIAIHPDDGAEIDTLFTKADNAMYFSKRHGRNTFTLYRATAKEDERQRVHLEIELRGALRKGEIYAVYQPQIDLVSRRVFGVEALMRWRHPQLGEVPPDDFIPVAEEGGLIVELGTWMLETACKQAGLWRESGRAPSRVSVNLSMHQVSHGDFVATMRRVLERTGMDPAQLVLEITESVTSDPELVTSQLESLKRLGIGVAIDDFGTGYSSLQVLRDYPADYLKIDRSFVSEMHVNQADRELVAAVIALAHNLGLRTVAEGVENEEQVRLLREQGADVAQGFYFGRPLSPEALEEWFAQA